MNERNDERSRSCRIPRRLQRHDVYHGQKRRNLSFPAKGPGDVSPQLVGSLDGRTGSAKYEKGEPVLKSTSVAPGAPIYE